MLVTKVSGTMTVRDINWTTDDGIGQSRLQSLEYKNVKRCGCGLDLDKDSDDGDGMGQKLWMRMQVSASDSGNT